MTTHQQDLDFIKAIIPEDMLDDVNDWIANHLKPEDVFSEDQLRIWATGNGYKLPE